MTVFNNQLAGFPPDFTICCRPQLPVNEAHSSGNLVGKGSSMRARGPLRAEPVRCWVQGGKHTHVWTDGVLVRGHR